MATFTGLAATNNAFTGTAGADLFLWAVANLDKRDRANGAGGIDTLQLTSAGALGATALDGVVGIEQITLAAGGNAITLKNANFTGVTAAAITINGGAGADTVNASALTGSNRIAVNAGGGLDVLRGGAGADVFRFAAGNLSGDTVAAGLGSDLLVLTTAGTVVVGGLGKVSGVETFQLAAGGNALTFSNANFTGVTGAKIGVAGGAGNDTINAAAVGAGRSFVFSTGTGLDTVIGGAGDDMFRFAAAALAGDTVRGGAGKDTLVLTTAGALANGALAQMAGVETIILAAGGNALKLVSSNFGGIADKVLRITGGAGNDTVDGFAVTAGNGLLINAGGGLDVLKGGEGADTFVFRATDLSGDTIAGRRGIDTLVVADAGRLGTGDTALAAMTGVETIRLAAGGNALTLKNANFSTVTGAKIAVIGGAGSDTVDASALTGVRAIDVTAGAGVDTLTGGAGADTFRFTEDNLTSADRVLGGAGIDTLRLSGNGTLAQTALAGVSGVETIQLAAGGNEITLLNANFTGVAAALAVIGSAGNDTVNASGLTGTNRIDVTAGTGADVLKGGAGADVFRFAAADLTSADTVQGAGGYDEITFTTAGAASLTNVTGIDQINLASGGNSLTLTDANFTVPRDDGAKLMNFVASAGNSVIDGSGLASTNSLYIYDRGGIDTVTGGAGADYIEFNGGAVFTAGDTFDGGNDLDAIFFDRSMDFLGSALKSVEQLTHFGSDAVSVTLGGESAAAIIYIGGETLNGVDDVFNIQLSAGSITDLSDLTLTNPDAADAINVVSLGGAGTSTSVTLSSSIATFTGSAGDDTVGFAAGGSHASTVNINGGGGNDRITYVPRPGAPAIIDGGTGTDTLVLLSGESVVLFEASNQITSFGTVTNFENVDASAATDAVGLFSRDDVVSVLVGSRFADLIIAGNVGTIMTGGLGADRLTGSGGDDRFYISSTNEAAGDTIAGGDGDDGIDLFGSADLSGATISGIETLFLAAGDGAGNFTNDAVTATLTGSQVAALTNVFGNGYFTDSTETLVVRADTADLDLSALAFSYWNSADRVEIIGRSGDDDIKGTTQNDIITGGGGGDFLFGREGDDIIGYDFFRSFGLYGDSGNDTVRLDSIDFSETPTAIRVDLAANAITESYSILDPYVLDAFNFENADFSSSVLSTTLIGTNGVNVLRGGSAADTITGGQGADTLTGGGGADVLTGGADADRFVWKDKTEGADAITDFATGTDKLVFDAAQFAVTGAFDRVRYPEAFFPGQNLTGADLVVVELSNLNAFTVEQFVDEQSITADQGMFVLARDIAGGNTKLYYSSNARGVGTAGTFFEIADLGAVGLFDLGINDFVFI